MVQGLEVKTKLSREALKQLERLSKSTWIDVLVAAARRELGTDDELQLLGLLDQWLEPICPLRKMRPPFLQANFTKARVVAREQEYLQPPRGKKTKLGLKLRKG